MSDATFAFAWEGASKALGAAGPWSHLRVVELYGSEAMSRLYRYEIILFSRDPAPEVDPEALIGERATLRILTGVSPAVRLVHGIVAEAEELGAIEHGTLYRVVLVPPLSRALYRTRCRIFLEKTTRQIIDAVLQGDPELRRQDGAAAEPGGIDLDFTPAREVYAWRINDPGRIDQAAARPYCVQYNESDLAFVARLLEEEGIGYHFEHGDGVCLLVLADADTGRARLDPFVPLDPQVIGRAVTSMKLGARLRPRKVSLLDYNWKNPSLDMSVATPNPASGAELVDLAYPGLYPDTPDQGRPLAAARLDRLGIEAGYAVGRGSCRLLGAGSIFAVENLKPRHEGEYLVTDLEVRAREPGVLPPGATASLAQNAGLEAPYEVTFECARRGKGDAPAESRFRPARVTPKPRIVGTQTAFVTAEPSARGAEINVGGPAGAEIGCVRAKFHWDKEADRHAREPTSCWIRVSQVFAGVGEGGVWHPRVGVEVVVEFEEGDPDRPIIVGRVYNGKNRPPGGAPTVSTLKSMTSPGGGSHNELRFDDTAGAQQILLHTPKDWNSEVGNDRSERIDNSSSSQVAVDRSENTGSNRSTMVGDNNTEVVGSNETITVGSNQATTVGVDQTLTVGSNQTTTIGANQTLTVDANQTSTIFGDQTTTVQGHRETNVTGYISTTSADHVFVSAPNKITLQCQGSSITLEPGIITITAGGQAQVVLDINALVKSAANSQVFLDANALMHSSTMSDVILDANACVKSSGASQVYLDATATMAASGGGQVFCDANVISSGAKATIASTAGGGAEFTANALMSGADVSISGSAKVGIAAPAVSSSAAGSNEITGAVVKIN